MPILSALPAPLAPPHAVTTMAAAATATPTRANFMNSSSNSPRSYPAAHDAPARDRRPWVAPRYFPAAAVTDETRARDPDAPRAQDAAKRCRIIGGGDKDARLSLRINRLSHRDGCSSLESLASRAPDPRPGAGPPVPNLFGMGAIAHGAARCTRCAFGVEYTIRPARITDIDRFAAIGRLGDDRVGSRLARCRGPASPACLPAARERARRRGATRARGRGVLVLRPSVTRRRLRGRVDFLVVAPDHDADRVTESLLEELLRSASNKGCSDRRSGSCPPTPRTSPAWSAPGSPPPGRPPASRSAAGSEPAAPSSTRPRVERPGLETT